MNSKISSKNNSYASPCNITIANGTEEQMKNLGNVSIYNSFIISIPQKGGMDDPKEASLWMTDYEGNLYELSRPISLFDKLEKRINALEKNANITPNSNNIIDVDNNT